MPCFTPAADWTRTWGRSGYGLISETKCILTAGRITICGWRLVRISVSRKTRSFISGARRDFSACSFYLTGKRKRVDERSGTGHRWGHYRLGIGYDVAVRKKNGGNSEATVHLKKEFGLRMSGLALALVTGLLTMATGGACAQNKIPRPALLVLNKADNTLVIVDP